MFKYIEPKQITLGNYENRTKWFAYYIPLKKTKKTSTFLESELWKNSCSHQSIEVHGDIFGDIGDRYNFKCYQFFIENPGCLKLILYLLRKNSCSPSFCCKLAYSCGVQYWSHVRCPIIWMTENVLEVLRFSQNCYWI